MSEYTDNLEHPTRYSYDKWGNITSLTDPMGYTESYTYDYLGNMLSKTDKNGNTVTFEYNTFGLASKTDGETQIINTYNGIGQLVSANTVEQNQTSYTYDLFGNIATVTQGDSVQSYAYDDNGNVTGYTLSIDGEQKASETYTYNNMNRLTAQNVNGKNYSFTYNANGNMTGRAVDGVTSETYTYNNAGLLVAKTGANGTYVNLYRPDGFKTKEIKGAFEKAFVYDDFDRLTTDSYVNGEEVLYTNSYTYDNRGNRLTMSDGTVTTNYTYDLNNRLVSKNKVTEGVETERISLFYDFNGNTVSQRTLTLGESGEMSVGVLGEGTNTGIKLFEYDGFNRLTKYTDDNSVASYTYYADNLRAGKTVNGASKQFYWNGSNLAGETSGTGVKTYSYDLLGVSAVNDGTATTYFAKDTHNDIVAHLNGEGEITSSQYFDSFGNKNTTITEDEFGYTGEYMDVESGLIYLRNRYYDPETGRFINEDPVRDGLNWYVYCDGNPVTFRDPWGLSYDEVAEAIGIIIDNKSRMLSPGTPSNEYWNAYSEILKTKEEIAYDVVYLENWSGMSGVLAPLINNDNNSISDLKAMKVAVEKAGKDSAWEKTVDDFLVTGAMVAVGAIAIKAIVAGGAASFVSRAVSSTAAPLSEKMINSLNHIFNKTGHNLGPLLQRYNGNQYDTYMAVQNAVQKIVNDQNLTGTFDSVKNPIVVNVSGFTVHVGGRVIDGVFDVGTFYIK